MSHVFHRNLIEKLPKLAAQNWLAVIDGKAKLDPAHADVIAEALKNWAAEQGATHYTHWFQPLLSLGFLETFRGKDLLRAEFDTSSFPSGGRGYTIWDPTVFPFLSEEEGGLTLCIPSFFFSWKGAPLDHRIPLVRSEEKLNQAVLRLLQLCAIPAERMISTLGIKQEYFVINRALFLLRPDLLLAGRALFGASFPKGQIKTSVMAFMHELEKGACALGIPIKIYHNEVAPAQYETASLVEKSSLAVDHNLLLMQLMQNAALKHDLVCLFHEKPFRGINGSGKHISWSIASDSGLNLLDPKGESLVFITLLCAILRAVHEHAGLLFASIASAGNDHRFSGPEAPPTILSVYLGEELEKTIREMTLGTIDLGLSDQSQPSFFAFSGNKFEFRAVGASANCGLPATVINAIVADSLQLILDEMVSSIGERPLEREALFHAVLPVLKKHFAHSQKVIFIRKSFYAFSQFIEKKTISVFEGILSEAELHSRAEILVEQYVKTVQMELNLMIELFQTQILPAAQKDRLQRGIQEPLIQQAVGITEELKKFQSQMIDLGWEAKGKVYCELIAPKMEELRGVIDRLEYE